VLAVLLLASTLLARNIACKGRTFWHSHRFAQFGRPRLGDRHAPYDRLVKATARELNQRTAQVLARVEAGETITVTKNGQPVATLHPYGQQDPVAYPFRTDPVGPDDTVPRFAGDRSFSEQADELLRVVRPLAPPESGGHVPGTATGHRAGHG
jgi:prevent-host-death family protein